MSELKTVLMVVPRYGNFGDFYQVPLGLAYIAAAAQSEGYKVYGLNLNHCEGSVSDLVRIKVKDLHPDVLATGGLSVFIDQINEIIQSAKQSNPNIFTILGGGVVSGEPDVILKAIDADIGVINEGEETIVEILNKLRAGEDLSEIKGVVVRTSRGRIRRNGERPQREDLENIRWPNYEILDLQKSIENQRVLDSYFFHVAPDDNPRSLDMISSRSCPFKCTFCFHPTGKTYRERPLDDFFRELESVKERFSINMIGIVDELFSLSRSRLLEFCKRIKPYNIAWMVQLHVNSASDETLRAMADSGCVYISYGIESMSQPVLDSMQKKSKKARVEEALRLTNHYKIGIQGNLLFGDSAETIETANESMDWWAHNRRYQINLTPLIVFPGSPDYMAALRDGLIDQKDRVDYIKDIPTNLNISSMNNFDMDMVRFMVYVYFESLLRVAKVVRFEQASTSIRGPVYDCEWECATCGHLNHYKNFIIPQDCKNSIRMTCRSCRERFDICNAPYREGVFSKTIPGEALATLQQAQFYYDIGLFAEAHNLANQVLGQHENCVEARLFLARFYETHGPEEHMVRSYGAAVTFDPFRPDLHFNYARALQRIGCNGGALLHLEQALTLHPGYTPAIELHDLINVKHACDGSTSIYFRSWCDDPPPLRRAVQKCGSDEVSQANDPKTIPLVKIG